MGDECKKLHNYYRNRHNHNFCQDCGKMLRYRGIVTKIFPRFAINWNDIINKIIVRLK